MDVGLWRLSDADLVACADAAQALAARAVAVQARLVAELAERGLVGSSPTAVSGWITQRWRVSPAAARRVVDLGRALNSPVLAGAVAAGTVNPEQANVIAAAVADLPADAGPDVTAEAEQALIGYAAQCDPPGLRRLGERILCHVAPDLADATDAKRLADDERDAHARRGFTVSPAGHGQYRVSGYLDAEGAATVGAAIDPLSAPTPDEDRSAAQRRADALVDVCALALATDDLPDVGGDRPQVVVTVDWDTLRDLTGTAMLDTGDPLTPAQALALAADLVRAVEGR